MHCQASTKFIAEMGGRVSSVSDANQFHNFEDDHWFLWLFIWNLIHYFCKSVDVLCKKLN